MGLVVLPIADVATLDILRRENVIVFERSLSMAFAVLQKDMVHVLSLALN